MKTPKKEAVKAPTIGDRLLTLREAAEVLRLNPRTVREYVQRGEIEGRIIGGRKFRRADLDAFFANAQRLRLNASVVPGYAWNIACGALTCPGP